ncbi:BPTD_3080 family restriction endonuclease [Chloroflexota bacterium]
MPDVVIENPILNSPYKEPTRHFKFSDDGITDEVIESRRISSYFIPIAQPKKRGSGKQLALTTDWTQDRVEENKNINRIRERVATWRQGGYVGITRTTRHLLEYWTKTDRDRKLFFCQIEALETAIYLSEVANRFNDNWIENTIREQNEANNPGLYRIAFKMATGSGKTVVMAMLIAWQVLNKLTNQQNPKFTDSFLIVTPGITIRDRLRVLYPNDPQNYYQQRDIVPLSEMDELGRAKIIITNFHTFKTREIVKTGKLTKYILANGQTSALTETPDQMVRRVCREFGSKKNIMVINDEAHHCYRHKVEVEDEKLTGDDRKEAQQREEEARVWISGLEAVKRKIGVKQIYDLSATPFFLRGSGYSEGTLFPWVVSDFSLIDAIECGIVKVPRVPISDDTMQGDMPVYRDIWLRIRDHLPKKERKVKDAATGEPTLPKELEGALNSLYGNYEKYYHQWEQNTEARARGSTPPVFIVVCNNTSVSKLVYDWIAGYTKALPNGNEVIVPGNLKIFDNSDGRSQWLSTPNTILIDSKQLESGEVMSKDFKKIAELAIEEFKDEYRKRFPGRGTENLTDEDLLREVMNTVGKHGKLGENVRCVVSVSMLTEGWDANTVTHIMGVRAFSTQLLCEQVVGRALRRRSYETNENSMFEPEYAEVYGVPFSFIPCSGSSNDKPPRNITRVRALDERIACEITFPRVIGYKYDVPPDRLSYTFNEDSRMVLSTELTPDKTVNAPIVGESTIHQLRSTLGMRREQEVAFQLAKAVLDKYFSETDGVQPWLFPQLVSIAREWIAKCITIKDNAFIQMLLITENRHYAAERIYNAIVWGIKGRAMLRPILRTYDNIGSTRYVDFDTTRAVYPTSPYKCHLNYMVADTESWEQKMAQTLEDMEEVICYVKNQGLEFTVPYVIEGEEKKYYPDFIVRLKNQRGEILNLIVEVTGEKKKEKASKVATARNLWVPAINNHGGFGRWAFIEISDPWDAKNTIRARLTGLYTDEPQEQLL